MTLVKFDDIYNYTMFPIDYIYMNTLALVYVVIREPIHGYTPVQLCYIFFLSGGTKEDASGGEEVKRPCIVINKAR